MENTTVYWIRHKDHKNIFSEGYIGVSINTKKRWNSHSKYSENQHLNNAIKLYGWDNLIKEILIISNKEYCYKLESRLRPFKQIGWNIAEGGKHPPITQSRGPEYISPLKGKPRKTPWLIGRKFSEVERKKISERQKVKVKYNETVFESFSELAKYLNIKFSTLANRIYRNPKKWGYEVLN